MATPERQVKIDRMRQKRLSGVVVVLEELAIRITQPPFYEHVMDWESERRGIYLIVSSRTIPNKLVN